MFANVPRLAKSMNSYFLLQTIPDIWYYIAIWQVELLCNDLAKSDVILLSVVM